MWRKLSFLTLFTLMMGAVGSTEAGLVAHWQLDETTGTTASDSSGNGYDGTLIGGPTWVAGVDGGALELDGTDDYVDFGNPGGWPSGTSPRSMCGWARTDTVAGGWRWIAAYGSAGTGQAMFIGLNGTSLYGGGYGDDIFRSGFWEVGQWYHIVLTYDGTTARLYADGAEVASGAKSWNLPLSRAHIGRQVNDAVEFWDGAVDDVRIYDLALRPSHVEDLANGLEPDFAKAQDPEPADGATGVTQPLLIWAAGENIFWHDLYIGTSPDLTEADLVAARQMFPMHYHVAGFEAGVTYYWRVDEIEANGTVHTGDVWSFTTVLLRASEPVPADGAKFQLVDVDLAWVAGQDAASHDVYFSTSEQDVADGAAGAFVVNQNVTTLELDPLALGTTYYWRVDEADSGDSKVVGDVWSFTTVPDVPVTDPNLVGWWTLDEGEGMLAVDWSGHGHHGELRGDPQWVAGYDGGALDLDGNGDFVDFGNPENWPEGAAPRSMCAWAKTDTIGAGWRWIAAYGSGGTGLAMFIGINGDSLYGGGYGDDIFKAGFWEVSEWRHACLTYDGTTARLYGEGVLVASGSKTWNLTRSRAHIGRQVNNVSEFWDGMVDDVRIYNMVLTPEQIQQAMRGDTAKAWAPKPADGYITDIREATPLSWSAGDNATQHDVYFGTDANAVDGADASDTTGVHRARQSGTIYTPPEPLEWGRTYYWRIDEINNDQTITTGRPWSFAVADYLIVDDFESYTNESPNRIFQAWVDGLGFSADDHFPGGDPGNGTGALVGHDIWSLESPHYQGTIAETDDPHSGDQAMPLYYNNGQTPYYSEAERTWAAPQDWTLGGVTDLSLWFKGAPVNFMETAPGAITMSGAGADIYMQIDEFRFAYKQLVGNGSITARIDSLDNTGTWARAGVMVRSSLDPVTPQAHMVVTPANLVEFTYRELANGNTVGISTPAASTPMPHWVRITRSGDTITGEHSADGVAWDTFTSGTATSSADVAMFGNVYIGLVVSSWAAGVPAVAEFSNVTTTGGVSGVWQVAEISGTHPANDRADFYVAAEDTAGRVVTFPYPDGAVVNGWTRWKIPLSDVAAAGVNTSAIKKMYVGVGNRNAPAPDGSGMVLVDDIQVVKPPAIVAAFAEDFESYEAGSDLHGQGGWKGWDNTPGAGAPASSTYASGGSHSVEVIGSADLVHEFDITGGILEFSAMQYIPAGSTGETFFILLNTYNDGGPYDWSVQLDFNLGTGIVTSQNLGGNTTASIVYDQWVELAFVIDLDSDTVEEYYNGTLLSSHEWDDNDNPTLQAIDLYGNGASSVYYDDITIE